MKFIKEFVVPAAVLTIICVVVSAALVVTYNTTKPIIEIAKIAEADKSRSAVLTGGKQFETQTVSVPDVVEAYKAANGAGYVFTAKTKGYGGDMYVMVGIKADGTIEAVKLLDNKETAGLGSQTGETKYTDKYKGKTGNDYESVDAITGSTVSSYAFRHGVKLAFDAYAELAGVTFAAPLSPEQMIFPDIDVASYEEITVEGTLKALKSGDNIILVTEAQGYSNATTKLQVYTGFGADGKIAGVALGENTETAGIGSQIGDPAYTDQYKGKDNVDGVEAVSGATESSDGMQAAVKKALEAYKAMSGGAAAPGVSDTAPAAPAAPSESDPAPAAPSASAEVSSATSGS